jgi:hypothetical protein
VSVGGTMSEPNKLRKLLKVIPEEMTYEEAIEWQYVVQQVASNLRSAVDYLNSEERLANRYDTHFTRVTR